MGVLRTPCHGGGGSVHLINVLELTQKAKWMGGKLSL